MVQRWCANACSSIWEQIASAAPMPDFASVYQQSIHERFEDMDKDELIRKLIWLQLKDTIDAYQGSDDLNAGYENKETKSRAGRSGGVRMFINLGAKDGVTTPEKLLEFITDSTDIEAGMIDRITYATLAASLMLPQALLNL